MKSKLKSSNTNNPVISVELHDSSLDKKFPPYKKIRTFVNPPNNNHLFLTANMISMASNRASDGQNSKLNKTNISYASVRNGMAIQRLGTETKEETVSQKSWKKKLNNKCENIRKYLSIATENLTYLIIVLVLVILSLISKEISLVVSEQKYDKYFNIYYYFICGVLYVDLIFTCVVFNEYFLSFQFIFDFFGLLSMIFENEVIYKHFSFFNIKINRQKTSYPHFHAIDFYIHLIRTTKLLLLRKLFNITLLLIQKRDRILASKRLLQYKEKKILLKKKKTFELKKKFVNRISSNHLVQITNLKPPQQNNLSNMTNSIQNGSSGPMLLNSQFLFHREQQQDVPPLTPHSATNPNESNTNVNGFLKPNNKPKNKKINRVISKNMNHNIIGIIFAILYLAPLAEDLYSINIDRICYTSITKYYDLIRTSETFPQGTNTEKFLFEHITNLSKEYYPIINVTYKNIVYFKNASFEDASFRFEEIGYALSEPSGSLVTFSLRKRNQLNAGINIGRVIFLYLLLLFLGITLGKDAKALLLNPIEDMIKIVDVVAKDPINSKAIDELKKGCQNSLSNMKRGKKSIEYEIKTIQFAIIRISALMAIGFGEAGGEILKENIQSSEGLNPMLEGKKINAIFGFCYIRNFSEINEALQEKTIIFVNQISEIVHASVDKFGGITNKNLGDCYLLVWKIKEDKKCDAKLGSSILEYQDQTTFLLEDNQNTFLADQALLAFLCVIKKIHKSRSILAYRENPELKEKLGVNFKVEMGFGLHKGWGIEGAIGSFYKIDCSYLSPNVNIAARLETATNIYGVDILFSGEFYDTLSFFMQKYCRLIDIVALKGCVTPVRLYTVDVNKNLKPGKKKLGPKMKLKDRRYKKNKLRNLFENEVTKTIGEVYIGMSRGMRKLLNHPKNETFLRYFKSGYKHYIKGNWNEAYNELKNALFLDKNDGPTKTLIKYIKKNNKMAPRDWKGFRKLESKT